MPTIDEKLKDISVEALPKDAECTPILIVESTDIYETINLLKNEYKYDMLVYTTAVDNSDHYEINYYLYSTVSNKKLILKTSINRKNPKIESIEKIYRAADWQEREIFDLFGIEFVNHPNLTRILLPQGWKGYPLRKDYVLDDERLIWNKR